MQRRYTCFLAILVVFGGGLLIAYLSARGVAQRRIEQAVESRIPSMIGPSGSYKVTASTGLTGLARGSIGSVKIEARDVQLKSGMKLKSLDTVLTGIHVDKAKHAVTKIDKASFTASITAVQLNGFIAMKYPQIADQAIALHDGYLTIQATPDVRGVKAHTEAEATLEVENGSYIMLKLKKVTSAGITAPDAAHRRIEEGLNPVLDVSRLGFSGRLTSVSIKPDAIVVTGTGEPGSLGKFWRAAPCNR